jgi:hypothetical protein
MKKIWTAAEMGRKGGKTSRRILTSEQARAMVKAREKKKKPLA